MNKLEEIDFEDLDEDLGRRSGPKKVKRTLDSDKVSPEDIIVDSSHLDNLNPEELFILKQEGKLLGSDSNPIKEKKQTSEIEPKSGSLYEALESENNGHANEEVLETTKEIEEVISKVKEEALSKERATLTSKKRDDIFSDTESHGKRGREPKKHGKGLETIKVKLSSK